MQVRRCKAVLASISCQPNGNPDFDFMFAQQVLYALSLGGDGCDAIDCDYWQQLLSLKDAGAGSAILYQLPAACEVLNMQEVIRLQIISIGQASGAHAIDPLHDQSLFMELSLAQRLLSRHNVAMLNGMLKPPC